MATFESYSDPVHPEPGRPRMQSFVNWSGALVSLALIAGMVIWGWELMVRDVSGVPVIQALEGPMRVEPDNPGGREADHQGLAVNRIAEGQEAAPAADQIVLAPPPIELAALERPAVPSEPLARTAVPTDDIAAPEPRPTPQVVTNTPATPPTPEAASEATLALIDELIAAESGETVLRPEPATETATIRTIPISIPGVRSSPRPALRPASLSVAAVATQAAEAEAAAPAPEGVAGEVDPETLPDGTRLVQLGAYDDVEAARDVWAELATTYPDYFVARDRIVQQALSGGREFYRLRAHGFADLMEARRFCTALIADGVRDCIPVTVR